MTPLLMRIKSKAEVAVELAGLAERAATGITLPDTCYETYHWQCRHGYDAPGNHCNHEDPREIRKAFRRVSPYPYSGFKE